MRPLLPLCMVAAWLGALPAWAVCPLPGATLPLEAADRYTNDPGSLLARHPQGGPGLIFDTRSLAADPNRHRAILTMIRQANAPQARAIGEGLGRAAIACLRLDPGTQQRIIGVVRVSANADVGLAYRRALGDEPNATLPDSTRATGPGDRQFGDPDRSQAPFGTTLQGQQPGRGLPGLPQNAPERRALRNTDDPFAPVELAR